VRPGARPAVPPTAWSKWTRRGHTIAATKENAMRQAGYRRRARWSVTTLLAAIAAVVALAAPTPADAAGSWLEYRYDYALGYAQPSPGVVARMAMRNFSAYFTFPGCGSEIHAGKICDLQFATTSNPIRVENTTTTSFTFRALPGHSEGANRVITFSFSYQQSDQQLHLGVWSRGPWTLTAQGSIDSGLARNSWVTFAGNLITAIRNGDYNNFSGPTPGELSDSANPAIVRNADGRLEAFVLSNGGTLFHSWQVTPGGGWSGWFILGDPSWKFWSGPAVGTNADGRLEVFVIGMD